VPDTLIVSSFPALLQVLAPCFTAPSFHTFVALSCGWVLARGRHTVTGVVRAASAVGWKHISSFHRFFARARWEVDRVGLLLVRLIAALVPKGESLVVPVDDTLGRHTGGKIAAAAMHRDPLLSTRTRVAFHWGHVWVVLGITIHAFGKNWCLPVLFRLYRTKKRCAVDGCPYRTHTQLAAELIRLLAEALPHRRIVVVGDAAYTNSSVIKRRPRHVTVVGRSRMDAALYALPPPRRPGQRGRPRVRGARLPTPAAQAAAPDAPWQAVTATVYGKTVTVRVLVIDALWYVAAGGELVRLIVVRGFPGHERDDAFVSTDPTMTAQTIIETIAARWPLETTFEETKGKLGLEEPQNRTERAVQRTAPMALWMYTLVVLWYLKTGCRLRAARTETLPWYRSKEAPAFSDMLATLRRASWSERLFDPRANHSTFRKRLRPLLDYLDAVA
jgi:hypothetical protein